MSLSEQRGHHQKRALFFFYLQKSLSLQNGATSLTKISNCAQNETHASYAQCGAEVIRTQLVSNFDQGCGAVLGGVKWSLTVEKEHVFFMVVRSNFFSPCFIVDESLLTHYVRQVDCMDMNLTQVRLNIEW